MSIQSALLAALRALLAGRSIDLRKQIIVSADTTAYGERTAIRIDHLLPDPRGRRQARWRVTTREHVLPRAHFARRAREVISSAAQVRGRRIFCIDLKSQQVMAALSYHLDDRPHWPVLMTALALRQDEGGSRELFAESRALGWLLKQYLHAVAEKVGRGGFVDIDAPNRPEVVRELELLGFRRAPQVEGLKPSGRHLRQKPA